MRWRACQYKSGSKRGRKRGDRAGAVEGGEGTVDLAESTRNGGSASCMGRSVPAVERGQWCSWEWRRVGAAEREARFGQVTVAAHTEGGRREHLD